MKTLLKQQGCYESRKTGNFWHNLYEENHKTLKDAPEKMEKHVPRFLLGRVNIMKMSDLPKLICKCNLNQIIMESFW